MKGENSLNLQDFEFQVPTPASHPGPVADTAINGFVLHLASAFLFVTYLVWAYVPHSWLNAIGITYLPHRHWAITIPAIVTFGLFGLSVGYRILNNYVSVSVTSVKQIRANDTPTFVPDDLSYTSSLLPPGHETKAIPPLVDIDPDLVSRRLYL